MELKVQLIYQADCTYAQRAKKQIDAAFSYLNPRLVQQQIYVRVLEKQGAKTHVYINGVSPFRTVQQACVCGKQQVCDGVLYDGEFFSHVTEAVMKDVVLERDTGQSHLGQAQQSHNRQMLSCCGSGCEDFPY
ncbi:MAG: hypothetical protein AAF708_17580 [Deinococcota bacterium]